ncbi:MAG TPA: LacI family DNA-binding transcriptional regulator [Sphingomicrobium sp.]|nr:LacI family DNA-binding transcriptional regulator [Sphingomicrobium sp.]
MSGRVTRLEDLARLAGVSIATVSRALNDSPAVTLETKRHIWKIAREHNYQFRRYMPSGPIGADATIVVVITRPQGRAYRLSDPFILELVAGIGEAARDRGCDVLVSHVAPSTYDDLSTLMSTSRADGVIFLGQSSLFPEFNRLSEEDNRFVVWGAQLPDQSYCSVGTDNLRGGKRATAHLARLGRKQIVFLGDVEAPEVLLRYNGYADALSEAGIALDPALVVPAHFEVEFAEAAVDSLIARGVAFDGIVAASDLIAFGAIRSLLHAGRGVPEDVSVVGYDDISFARYSHPALTTISQDTTKAGRLLVSKLLSSGREEIRSERLPTDLIVRESCGG